MDRELLESLAAYTQDLGLTADQVLWAGAVGFTQVAWRNTALEDWHASPTGLDDGEMMRANASTTRIVHEGLVQGQSWADIATRITAADRLLPDGRTLRSAMGRVLHGVREEAADQAATQQAVEDAHGREVALSRAVALTTFSGSDWWGMPSWPPRVRRFIEALSNPRDPHWGEAARWWRDHEQGPPMVRNLDELQAALLAGPDTLDAEAAAWCVSALIGYLRTSD